MASNHNLTRSEREAHCWRVQYLCSNLASRLSLREPAAGGLARAAAAHESGIVRAGDLAGDVLRDWKGLGTGESDAATKLSARILEICDDFDEAVEFCAFERLTIAQGIAGFFADPERSDARLADALRQCLAPKCVPRKGGNLPVLPRAVARLLRTSAETASAAELESIAASDPALTARVVGAANSASFGSRSSIQQLGQAILRVGVPFARKVLISACFEPLFASTELRDLWNHSRVVAGAAHEFAAICGIDQETAYVAGLVHDIGRLVMQRTAPETRVAEAVLLHSGFPLVYAETLLYGGDHAECGAELLRAWGLPAELVDAVLNHHCPEATASKLASLLYLAEDYSASVTGATENLCAGLRRALALGVTGMDEGALSLTDGNSPIFAIAS